MMATPTLRFYFDYISTNAYIAWRALPALAERTGVTIEPVPVLFAGLLASTGQLGPAEVPIKARWMWRNCLRKAAHLGIPLEQPRYHPFNPLLALRVSSLPMDAAERSRVVTGLFDAVWVHRLHISEPEVVAAIAGADRVAAAQAAEAKARLRGQTDAAIAAGVFGVPAMAVGDEVFWGYDDFPYLEEHLSGGDPLPSIDDAAYARPAASARRRQAPS